MDSFYVKRSELSDKFYSLIKNKATEDELIQFIDTSFRIGRFDFKALEVIVDLSITIVGKKDSCDNDSHSSSEEGILSSGSEYSYDADDEGQDGAFIFPCHLLYEDCHPDLLHDYHHHHLEIAQTSTHIISRPRICDLVIKLILNNLEREAVIIEDLCRQTDSKNPTIFTANDNSNVKRRGFEDCLDSTIIMINKLIKICSKERKNCRILSQTDIMEKVLDSTLFLIRIMPEQQNLYLNPLLKLIFQIADYTITGDNLKKLFEIIKSENVDLSLVLSNFECILDHHHRILKNIQPLRSINFPSAAKTAEELLSDPYVSNSWHWHLRNKVIDFKRRHSRLVNQDEQANVKESPIESTQYRGSNMINQITPSWLECSFITPLSSISSLMKNGQFKLTCSVWISICGDVFVTGNRNRGNNVNDDGYAKDWVSPNGYWLRLISKRRLARKAQRRQPRRIRRLSAKLRLRQAHDLEDDEKAMADADSVKKQADLNSRIASKLTYESRRRSDRSFRFGRLSPADVSQLPKKKLTPPKEFLGSEAMIHLISFAIDAMTIEIWLNVKTMTFCAKACRLAREGLSVILDQVTFSSHLDATGKWSHIIFTLEESPIKQGSLERCMDLKVIVNGINKEKERLVYGAQNAPRPNFACLIGCERSAFGYVWKLSQLHLFRDLAPKDVIMFLLGRGPNSLNFTNFKQFTTLVLPDIAQRSVKSLLDPVFLQRYRTIDVEKSLNWLTRNIQASYSAQHVNFFLDYSTASLMNIPHSDYEGSNNSERFIQVRILDFTRRLKLNTNHGFGSALVIAGGIESALVCFADIVRRSNASPSVNALAFSLLIKLAHTNQYHLDKFFDELNGMKLIEFILVHPECKVSKAILNHYLELCIIKKDDHSLLKSPKLVHHLMSCWRAWHKDTIVAKHLYRKLIRLLQLRDGNFSAGERKLLGHFVNHNFEVMTSAGGIDSLMNILRECLVPIDEDCPKINHELIELIVNLISLLIKHPPGLDVMLDIMEFLLFLHPDHKAYVEVSSNKLSYLRMIQYDAKVHDIYEDSSENARSSSSDGGNAYRYSSQNFQRDVENGTDKLCKRIYNSQSTIASSSSSEDLDDQVYETKETSGDLFKFVRQFNAINRRGLSPLPEKYQWFDSLNRSNGKNLNQDSQVSPDTNKRELPDGSMKCSNRNFAIANIADMLASIVKLTSTDPMGILSDALQKPIIDLQKMIILANNSSSLVREKVLRLFLYCIKACYSLNLRSVLNKFEEDSGDNSEFKTCIPILLMSRQLLKYPTTIKMVKLCYGIIVGIDDFETVDNVCLMFDIDYINSDLQLNALILLINLMTQIDDPRELVSTIKFVLACMKQLLQTRAHDIALALIEHNLIDCIMKLYFRYIEHIVSINMSRGTDLHRSVTNVMDEYEEAKVELDKALLLITRFYIQSSSTQEAIKSINQLLIYFDLLNSHIPAPIQFILRDRKVKVLSVMMSFCKLYESCAKKMTSSSKFFYNLKNLWRKDASYLFENEISDFQLDSESEVDQNIGGVPDKFELDDHFRGSAHTIGTDVQTRDSPKDGVTGYDYYDEPTPLSVRKITEHDVIERIKATFDNSINYILTREIGIISSQIERRWIFKCLRILSMYLFEYNTLIKPLHFSNSSRNRSLWNHILDKLELNVRNNFSRLALFLISPCDSNNLDERKYYALKLLDMFSPIQLLELLDSDVATKRVMYLFTKELINYDCSPILNSEDSAEEQDDELLGDDTYQKLKLLADILDHQLKSGQTRYGKNDRSASMTIDLDTKLCNIWLGDLARMREETREKLESLRLANKSDLMISTGQNDTSCKILDEALKITRDVVNDKHGHRKAYFQDVKVSKVYYYHVRQHWLALIIAQTHERATWFMKEYYPVSWELNPVEGPSRIRRRLRPCKLNIESRYLRNNRRNDPIYRPTDSKKSIPKFQCQASRDSSNELSSDDWFNHYCPHPLCCMVVNHEQSLDSNELRIRMFTTDEIHYNCDCTIVRPNEVCEGEVSIATWCIHFIGERTDVSRTFSDGSRLETRVNDQQKECDTKSLLSRLPLVPTLVEDLWFDEIVEIWDRRYQLQDVGLEIFLTNNMTYLFSFRSHNAREDFKQNLMRERHKMINLQKFYLSTSLTKLTKTWREGGMTNFDYLTCLNKLSGRSFNDLMQYPIFPFILSNYLTDTLDLNQESNFRNLKKPMAIQNEEKEAIFINNFDDSRVNNSALRLHSVSEPYHYGNHYSNSATVLHFLVRLPPFTQMLIQYQDNNFDQPDRTFHSLSSTWQLITRDSNTDFKELIPEFFFLPEMFINSEQFELGLKQNNELVDDVKLPPWCPNSNARLFTLIHRQALESSYVNENLHHWIDLIFGYKQTGKPAIEAINVFHPATYYGMVDLNCMSSISSIPTITKVSISSKPSRQNSGCISTDYISSVDGSFKKLSKNNSSKQFDIDRLALETMIKTYGQMPRQLFTRPSKPRLSPTLVEQINGPSQLKLQVNGSKISRKLEALRQVKGLRWGSYVGSPEENEIVAMKHENLTSETDLAMTSDRRKLRNFSHCKAPPNFNLCLLPNGDIAILRDKTTLMLDYRADRKSAVNYQPPLTSTRYFKRAGLSSIARVNLFSNMIISRQQFSYTDTNSSDITNVKSPSLFSSVTRERFFPESLSLLSWGYLDGIIRIKHSALTTQAKLSIPLVQADSAVDNVSVCTSVPELNLLLVGFESGAICAHIISTSHETAPLSQYNDETSQTDYLDEKIIDSAAPASVHFLHSTSSSVLNNVPMSPNKLARNSTTGLPLSAVVLAGKTLQSSRIVNRTTRWLYCHAKRINCMKINVNFGIVVTGSEDGTCTIWDLNSLTYVRTINYKITATKKRSSTSNHSSGFESDVKSDNDCHRINGNECNENSIDYLCGCEPKCSFIPSAEDINNSTRQGCMCEIGINLLCISDTLGDIVSTKDVHNRIAEASYQGNSEDNISKCSDFSKNSTFSNTESDIGPSSVLYCHTVNGALVGIVQCPTQVTAVSYSSTPEGVSINVIVVGLADGMIRMYSSWDLSRVKEFHVSGIDSPVSSILYSRDNRLLYIAYHGGDLVVLRNKKKSSIIMPKEWKSSTAPGSW